MSRTFVYTPATYRAAIHAIQQALDQADFDKLDRMHVEFLALHEAGGNGSQMLAAFSDATRDFFHGQRPERYAGLFVDWNVRFPDSALRPAMEAVLWWRLAWNARGGGWASEVPPEAFDLHRSRLMRATQVLKEGQARGMATPLWYWIAISIAGSMGQPPQVLDGLFEEGASKWPFFVPLYGARLNFLLPQWGGDYRSVDEFIRGGVLRTQATQGTTLYTSLYQQVHSTYRGSDFFGETGASWRLMRHGFEDQIARKEVDLNAYATFACIAADRQTTRRLLAQLGEAANLGSGMQGFTTETCVELAKEGG